MNTAVLSNARSEAVGRYPTQPANGSGIRSRTRLSPGHCIASKYLIRGVLGSGGFGVVYEAEHLGLQCPMAIKVLHVTEGMPETLLARFAEEVKISASVHHRNLLDVHDTGTLEDGSPYLVMERIDGETLHACINRGDLSIDQVLDVARQLITALCELDCHHIVHRDIKPANLMLQTASNGERIVKLVDFGIAKIVRSEGDARPTLGGALVGTPHYMSPEHLCGEEVDALSDLYAAGIVLYEALTSQLPYDGASLPAIVCAALAGHPGAIRNLRPDCPSELERIVLKAMQRNRRLRYPSPQAMLSDLEDCARKLRSLPRAVSPDAALLTAAVVADELDAQPTQVWSAGSPSMVPTLPRTLPSRITTGRLRVAAACVLLASLTPDLPDSGPPPEAFNTVAAQPPGEGTPVTRRRRPSTKVTTPVVTSLAAPEARRPIARTAADPSSTRATTDPRRSRRRVPAANEGRTLLKAALAHHVRGRDVTAYRLYRRAVTSDPTVPQALRGLGLVAASLGHVGEARDALERYLVLSPDARDAQAIRRRLAGLSCTGARSLSFGLRGQPGPGPRPGPGHQARGLAASSCE